MLIRTKAPLRISFAGGGTDVPPFPQQMGGCVLSTTINLYAYGTLRERMDRHIGIESLDYGMTASFALDDKMAYDGKLDLVKAAINRIVDRNGTGFDLFLHTDVPPGSGLGSSSAMMVALVGLLKDFRNLPLTDHQIAELAYEIERKDLGIQGGLQDQYAATFGGFNYIEFLADRVVVNPLNIPDDVVNELQYNLLLCYTGEARLSANIIADQVGRYERGENESRSALSEIKALTVEMKNALLKGKLDDFASLLDVEWQQKRRMSPKISTARLDELYETAKREGVLGGKIAGAGGGGYMLLYCRYDRRHKVAETLTSLGCRVTEFAFEPKGMQCWRIA